MIRVIHAITPGDHYSPRTGSAIPTVVHGIAKAAAQDASQPSYQQFVLVARDTFRPRYDSATSIEFEDVAAPSRSARAVEAGLAVFGGHRTASARYWQPEVDVLANEEPAIVIAHNAPVLPWMLRSSPHRVVLYAHNDLVRTMTRFEASRAFDSVAAIVCVSESLARQMSRRLPRSLVGRLRVVENGVDCEQFSPRGHVSTSAVRVMFVGRMIPEKGADVLLQAAAVLSRDDVELVIVGSQGFDRDAELSPYEQELRELAKRSRVPVQFLPFVAREELPGLLQSADIVVVPSRWQEPSALTAGEALATGLPVIASRIGGIPSVLGTAGVLVQPDDPAALAREIERLADDPLARAELAAAARRRAQEHDWSWTWSTLKTVLAEL
jgi:glycosyltransferase involved in cell wall biosynthesis